MSMQTHKCALPRPRSGQFGNYLQVFLRRPCAGGASAHIAQRAERQRKFGNVVAVRRIDENNEIAVAAGEIKMFDLDAHLLSEIAGGFRALRRVLDLTNSL